MKKKLFESISLFSRLSTIFFFFFLLHRFHLVMDAPSTVAMAKEKKYMSESKAF